MRKPSFKQAEWIASRMDSGTNPDDVYDVLLSNITSPRWFVEEVQSLALDYEADLETHNIKLKNFGISTLLQ